MASDTDPQPLAATPISDLMTRDPIACSPDTSIRDAAARLRESHISSILVTEEDRLIGLVTTGDISGRAVASGRSFEAPVSEIMTRDLHTLGPGALGSDVLHEMLERGIGHVPVLEHGRVVGIVTQTDLTRRQALTAGSLIQDIVKADSVKALTQTVQRIPQLLTQLVAGGGRHDATTRLITDIADAATRRLLQMAEDEIGPPPVPYLWLACGSQGRQEQTGVSDQDNCLILSDQASEADDEYFATLARFVSNGLDACGYFYCPGDMMATNPRWRQPLRVWREYFDQWIEKPDPMARMLASVMFDLRPIGGSQELFGDLHRRTLERASQNSIFVAHMIANSLAHQPPLGLFGGISTESSGAERGRIDLKHNGVVPIIDLARVYALQGRIEPVNTRMRLVEAISSAAVSTEGGRDLLDAYDLIAETRLRHQAEQIREGRKPSHFVDPKRLSRLERDHLRRAFQVVQTMQSAISYGRSAAL